MNHAEDYYANYGGEAVADYVRRHLRGSASEVERLQQLCARLPSGVHSVLDVGAGHGLLLEALRDTRGLVGTGIEITQAKVDYGASLGLDLRLGDASRLDFADRSFDAVVCCEVLEHLPYGVYEAALAELARVARDWVMVSVPFAERRGFVRCPYCSASVNPNYHFRSFDEAAMRALLPGFVVEQVQPLGREAHGWLKSWLRTWLPGAWPSLLVCPSCGWRAPARAAAAPPVSGLRSLASRLPPTPTRALWWVAVYRRHGA
jgi:SAM-dependent methyltransferase